MHGWCCDRHYWREQVDHCAARHRVVCLDLAGYGALWDVEQERSPEQVAAFMAPFRADFAKATRGFVRRMFTPAVDAGRAEAITSAVVAAPSVIGTEALEALHGKRPESSRRPR